MVWIAGQTMTGSSNQVQFDSIPQTFTHLQIRISARSSQAVSEADLTVYGFNGTNANSNSAIHALTGDGSSAFSFSGTAQFNPFLFKIPGGTTTANTFGSGIIDILDYPSTTKMKVLRSMGGYDANGSGRLDFTSVLAFGFGSATALANIWFYTSSNYSAGSRFDLYGITSSQVTGA